MPGIIFDVGSPCEIGNAIVRNNGNEIEFDYVKYEEKGRYHFTVKGLYHYTVTVRRVNGNLFRGEARSEPGGDVAEVVCRVYEERDEGNTYLVGSHWQYPTRSEDYQWLVRLQV